MILKQKLKLLRLLDRTLNQSSPLSLRVLGISEDEAKSLADEQLVSLGIDSSKSDVLDQCSIVEVLDAGLVLLAKNPERAPILPRIGKVAFSGLWDLVKVGAGVVLGWFLKKHFG